MIKISKRQQSLYFTEGQQKNAFLSNYRLSDQISNYSRPSCIAYINVVAYRLNGNGAKHKECSNKVWKETRIEWKLI